MQQPVELTVTRGHLAGRVFSFGAKTTLVIGRQEDCGLTLPDEKVSRRHCVLQIDPPFVRVQDCGSLNGTYLNGTLIGGRQKNREAQQAGAAAPWFEMQHGDCLGVGSCCDIRLCSENKGEALLPELAGYERLELLGKGQSGYVWRVCEKESGEQFALKMLYLPEGLDAAVKEKYLREANYAVQLSHPAILRHYKSGELGEVAYLLQEVCEGGSVQDWMDDNRGRPLPFKTATHIMLQVLDALAYAHAATITVPGRAGTIRGIVHRDVKPGNILVGDRGERPAVKLGDFGLSKLIEMSGRFDPTLPTEFAGSPDYTSKLQIRRYADARPEMDVWSAAATYYYMLTGWPPKDLKYGNKWKLSLIRDARPIQTCGVAVPDATARVIDEALREDPDHTAVSAAELKARIEASL